MSDNQKMETKVQEKKEEKSMNYTERIITKKNGMSMLLTNLAGIILSVVILVAGIMLCASEKTVIAKDADTALGVVLIIAATILFTVCCILFAGLKSVNPNEALVFTLFGTYYGTIREEGFYWVNPFVSAVNPTAKSMLSGATEAAANQTTQPASTESYSKKVSLKTMTLNNEKQKVNDSLGNPIIVGSIVIWKVVNPTKAVFEVENFKTFLSIQCDSAMRNIARLYPYDDMDESDGENEKTLRGSSQEVADELKKDLQKRVESAGLEIVDVRITHLAYAPEIAAAMLQRQQATAIIAARRKIVEGAVSMCEMALQQLSEEEIVVLDDERKAAMVSNLLVVLCGNKDAQPIVNSGSIY